MATKVCHTPTEVGVRNWFIRMSASGAPIMAPPPKPMMAMPVAMQRRSGNHLISVETGEMYPRPRPTPADDAGAEPHDPELMDVNAEGADQQAAGPAQGCDKARLARTDPFEPAAPDRGRDTQHDEEQCEHPPEAPTFQSQVVVNN